MRKVKDTIPVYDICSLGGTNHQDADIIAARFADYLKIHPNLHLAHGHSFYHLVLFTRGAGYHTIDFERFPVEPGQVYFMVPGQVHSWSFEGETDGYVVNFSEALFQSFLRDSAYPDNLRFFSGDTKDQVVRLSEEALQKGVTLLEQVVVETQGYDVYHTDAARLQLLLFFIQVARQEASGATQPQKNHPGMLVLQNFRKLLHQHYHHYKHPRDYAALLYVTPNYLNALCKDLLDKSAGELIRERLLLEAKRQLVNLEEGIAGIGYSLGFADNSYFTKFFKKYAGITPEEFRRELQTPPSKS